MATAERVSGITADTITENKARKRRIIKCAVKPLALAMGISGARRQAKFWVDPSQTVAI